MSFLTVSYFMGNILKVEGILLFIPFIVSIIYRESQKNIFSFLAVILLLLLVGMKLTHKKPEKISMKAKDGFIVVALSWLFLSFFGALPFYISGEIPSLIDAFFETASGFTTTGSSILTNVEALSHSMIFWRSFTHLIGGMGVLVFALAILPASGFESVNVMRAEVPGPVFGKLVSKMQVTARILYGIYLVMTLILIVLLLLGGMDFFDCCINAFGAAGTGGFSNKNNSIAFYDSSYIHMVLGVGMLLFGVNFNLYYLIMIGEFKKVFKSEELKVYLGIVFAVTTMIFINLGKVKGFSVLLLRDVFFQVSSLITTTGFVSADTNIWPLFSKCLLLFIMFTGACAGSTAGGLKISRVCVLFKAGVAEIKRVMEPNRIVSVKFDGESISKKMVTSILNYFAIYSIMFTFFVLLIALDDVDFMTAFSSVCATFNNIGPGFSLAGATSNFGFFSPMSKIILSFSMIFGRLEIYPMIILIYSVYEKARYR